MHVALGIPVISETEVALISALNSNMLFKPFWFPKTELKLVNFFLNLELILEPELQLKAFQDL